MTIEQAQAAANLLNRAINEARGTANWADRAERGESARYLRQIAQAGTIRLLHLEDEVTEETIQAARRASHTIRVESSAVRRNILRGQG